MRWCKILSEVEKGVMFSFSLFFKLVFANGWVCHNSGVLCVLRLGLCLESRCIDIGPLYAMDGTADGWAMGYDVCVFGGYARLEEARGEGNNAKWHMPRGCDKRRNIWGRYFLSSHLDPYPNG